MRARVCEKTVHIKTCVSVRMHIIYIYIYILCACPWQCVCLPVLVSWCCTFVLSVFVCVWLRFQGGWGSNRGRDTDALVTASLVDVVGADKRLAGATASLASVAKTPCGPINLMS